MADHLPYYMRELKQAQSRVAELEREVAELREALKPFAIAHRHNVPKSIHDKALIIIQATAGQLRRAAALAVKSGVGDGR